ncbi:hypothetical protein HPB48_019570 [Haemaphysalis longicornis]|uniref:RING-type E3 ubiquitin transferase n=1 Tax=Haemaphysalis longicornis TaxID=44386 RepID=A0A9J6FF47_HAELO|nr:hypothetical protein HPB48_019570 [Haemaphysalis longicornis]
MSSSGRETSWELSLYELNRTPQELITDSTEIAVSPSSLEEHFRCAICLDLTKNTMASMVCLHRFCQECIVPALRRGNKQCPICRTKLATKRSLRPDPNFDSLIEKLYPSGGENEAHQEQLVSNANRQPSQALAHSVEEGMSTQALNRGQRVRKHGGGEDDGGSGSTAPSSTAAHGVRLDGGPAAVHGGEASAPSTPGALSAPTANSTAERGHAPPAGGGGPLRPKTLQNSTVATESTGGETEETDAKETALNSEIELVLKPQPQMMREDSSAQVRYIKITANAKVAHVSTYLAIRLALEKLERDVSVPRSVAPFSLSIAVTPGQFALLPGSMTLDKVNKKFWTLNKPLELYYWHHLRRN